MAQVYTYAPSGVCARQITFSLDDDKKIHDLSFVGGCDGNLKAIGRLLEGMDAACAANILRGNQCRNKGTSCADQLAHAIDDVLARS